MINSSSQSLQWCHEGHSFIEIHNIYIPVHYIVIVDLFHVINCTDTCLKLGFNCNLPLKTTHRSPNTQPSVRQTAIFPCALLSLILSVNIDSIACPSSFHEHKQPWWQGTPSLMSLLDTIHRSVDDQASFHSYSVVVTCI